MISLRSDLRSKVLTFFYVNRSARVYVRRLAADLQVDSTNLSRELARLQREGFLRAEPEGRQLYYRVNPAYPYLKPVFALLQGSIGIVHALRRALAAVPGIESAWLYGSFAKNQADAASDIDLLILINPDRVNPDRGQLDQPQLASVLRKTEKLLRREINYTILTSTELNQRLAANDAFVTDAWNGKRIELILNGNHLSPAREPAAGQVIPV